MPPGEQMALFSPVEEIDVLLMGDILDPLHSTLWLEKSPAESEYVRPWTDSSKPGYAAKLKDITAAILKNNVVRTLTHK